ncbi:hypothetical protein GBL98_02245 [Yersinia pseudotuberculosis]|uniref:Uncharacterized protein n=3 Tax=Yersinia pseudotuberculosis TaxID=633 RepID=A0ABM7ANP2_YERPU|nr:hypothetical protein EGX87_17070 [Yersinia pseudotuberculosis]AYW93959.1 hypothetical protein EGX47_23265 [Yersinia pseudotuberculosis]AYW98060.1 hypothetical protein EGX39_20880 [Yersinia pseudotuberculosis]AYW99505.1 hypothetical protein EGX53_06215 [Yersinia pseudotuberculosis]AYX15050.1 hypothetical protein EGX44_07540 [Yersinia pseudotuberculosis]
MKIIIMLRKTLIILIAVMALSSLGGVFLAGLNIYTRSTTPHETNATEADVTETDATETSLVPGIGPAGLSNTGQESP